MPAQNLYALLGAAQARVRGARSMLAHPRDCRLDECVTQLREAQGYLEWLRDNLTNRSLTLVVQSHHGLRAPIVALAAEIRQAGILLEQAARLGRRWLERWQAASGYTSDGAAVPLAPRGRISFFG